MRLVPGGNPRAVTADVREFLAARGIELPAGQLGEHAELADPRVAAVAPRVRARSTPAAHPVVRYDQRWGALDLASTVHVMFWGQFVAFPHGLPLTASATLSLAERVGDIAARAYAVENCAPEWSSLIPGSGIRSTGLRAPLGDAVTAVAGREG